MHASCFLGELTSYSPRADASLASTSRSHHSEHCSAHLPNGHVSNGLRIQGNVRGFARGLVPFHPRFSPDRPEGDTALGHSNGQHPHTNTHRGNYLHSSWDRCDRKPAVCESLDISIAVHLLLYINMHIEILVAPPRRSPTTACASYLLSKPCSTSMQDVHNAGYCSLG